MTINRMKKYDDLCNDCPYNGGNHLDGTRFFNPKYTPLKLESNNSEILLVFQSPGEEEWQHGIAILPTKKQGGSAGLRILNSWKRCKRKRKDFDITNIIQCFPGKKLNGRDAEPNKEAVCICKERIRDTIENGNYSKIIIFGSFARKALEDFDFENIEVINVRHPCGGANNKELDNLW